MLSTVALLPLLVEAGGRVSASRVLLLLAGCVAGLPVGVFLLERLNADAL